MATLQYNGHATNDDICTTADDMVGTDDNTYTLESKTRSANSWMRTVWTWIFSSYGGWQYDDGNQTDLPSATDTLTADKTYYALPSTAITIRGISVKQTSGIWIALDPATEEQIQQYQATDEFAKNSSIPRWYVPKGNSVKIYPAATWTQSSSFKVFFDRGSVSFVSTDTTATPGFASEFHDVIPTGMAYDYARRKNLPTKNDYLNDLIGEGNSNSYKKRIMKFYSQRYQEMFPARITVEDKTKESI